MTATESLPSRSASYRTLAAPGFSLVELAVAVFIITLLLGSILVPLQSQVESRKYDDTQRLLDQAREALLGYAAANGYFPCPADYALGSLGAEVTHTLATGVCAATVNGGGTGGVYIGFLPAVTLGFTPIDAQGYAVDAWGLRQNRIRYAVSYTTVGGTSNPFTRTNGIRNAGMANILAPASTLLSVCNTATGSSATACAAGTALTTNAIVVIWSLGPNAATSGGVSTHEVENAEALAAADRVFVMRTKSAVTASEFDDVVTWISPPMLFNRLIAAGQLP